MEMLQCVEPKYSHSMRSDAPYTSHPYLSRDPVLPIETQQPSNQPYIPTQSKPQTDFNKSEYFLQNQRLYQNNSDYQQRYSDNSNLQKSEGGQVNQVVSSSNSQEQNRDRFDQSRDSTDNTRDKTYQSESRINEKPEEQVLDNVKAVDNIKDSSSPLSSESLSDSEVPDTGKEKRENYKQAGYYKEYLKRYSETAEGCKESGTERNPGDESSESQKENFEPDKQPDNKPNEGEEKEGEPPVQLEEAVKETLDEVIRQHHLRIAQPLREHDTQPRLSPSPSQDSQPTSQHNTPYAPRSGFTSPQLSPFPNPTRHPDFQRADSDPLSPRAAHIRQLQFSGEASPPRRDFGPLGPGGFPHPGAGIPLPNPFQHQLSQQLELHIQRSRANTLPATDLIGRPRSDSFSSLPEGRRKREGGQDYYYCHLCSYVGTTDFHFQAHMNSHFEHQCPHCDYKSRTEGRLKRHIKDFHTEDNPPDFTGGRIMRREPGKPKLFRCRQCDFVAQEKEEYWKHARSHIKDDKCLQCPKCAFVTEYKHHLEYHLRNHFGSKPFKCNKCNYSCVNKSMLNSHMKSHTNIYQYRCADCTYATKYCHSLKLHLHKYNHKPAMVLNSDGSLPNDGLGDFDLVSKRGPPRGPRSMKRDSGSPPGLDPVSGIIPPHMHPMGPNNPLNGMQAMMSGFWPNGVAPPPPLIPVSGLPPIPLPQNLNHSPINITPDSQSRHMGGPRGIKCQLCDFSTESPPMMIEHTIRVHGRDNSDLFDMFNLGGMRRHDMLGRDQAAAAQSLESMRLLAQGARQNSTFRRLSGADAYDRSISPPSPRATSPYDNRSRSPARSLSDYSPKSSTSEQHKSDKPQNGERPLDLTNAKLSPPLKRHYDVTDDVRGDVRDEQPGSAASAHSEGGSLEEGSHSRPSSPTPRKRSRKGNPFKLDAISMKLQTQYPANSEENTDGIDESELQGQSRESYHSNKLQTSHSNAVHNNNHISIDDDSQNGDSNAMRSNASFDKLKNSTDSSLEAMDAPRDTESPPTPPQDDILDQSEGAIDSAQMFSASINRRKILEKFNRRESATTNGKIYQTNDLNFDCEGQDGRNELGDENDIEVDSTKDNKWSKFSCHHCGIAFQDCIMYTIHSGYHGYKDPFQCNMCGVKTNDKVEFFLHIARTAHS